MFLSEHGDYKTYNRFHTHRDAPVRLGVLRQTLFLEMYCARARQEVLMPNKINCCTPTELVYQCVNQNTGSCVNNITLLFFYRQWGIKYFLNKPNGFAFIAKQDIETFDEGMK